MKKICKNCNQVFEGDVCPNCNGTEWTEELAESIASESTPPEPQLQSDVTNTQYGNSPNKPSVENMNHRNTDSIPKNEYQKTVPAKSNFKFDKRTICEIIGGLAILFLIIFSSGRVSKDIYQSKVNELKTMSSKLDTTETKLSSTEKEYNTYKEKMKPFEEMTAAQAAAEKVKADQVVAEQKAAEEQAAAEKKAAEEQAAQAAAAAAAAEAAQGYETGITYDQLARTPNDFIGQKAKFYGKVIQVIENGSTIQIRLAVDDNYDTILFGEYSSSIVPARVLEDDHITIYGVSTGTISYKSTLGGTITIPGMSIDQIDQ